MNDIISELAAVEYELFVVNTHAVAVQGDDGKYYTKYFQISPFVIQSMLFNHGSLGCYQQVYRSNFIRWICLDFDCKKDMPVNIDGLYNDCVLPITEFLDKCGINYLLEFSGRRGIHIWIIFEKLIKKSFGFRVISEILDGVPKVKDILNQGFYGLDRFPATGIDKKSKVGKQVKFPLSWHKKGSRSFFFRTNRANGMISSHKGLVYFYEDDFNSSDFYLDQLDILKSYTLESQESICGKLAIDDEEQIKNIYTKYSLISGYNASVTELVEILSETKVYKKIFQRFERGQALPQDWLVLLGTFSSFNSCTEILTSLFSQYPNYDVDKTLKNIRKLKDRYYSATFEYLYKLYDLPSEEGMDLGMTGVEYLSEKLSFDVTSKDRLKGRNENLCLAQVQNATIKELDYLQENDEVISVSLFNKLSNIRKVEIEKIECYVDNIINMGKTFDRTPVYTVYTRIEEAGKVRQLVSLDSFDRILTTSLVLRLCREMKHSWKSYSYRISYLETGKMFFPWFSSWSRYIDEIKAYIELPFMENNYISYLDLKHCYENIDMLVIYQRFKDSLSDNSQRVFEYLCSYNDGIMKDMNHGKRIGVPQGPAYARILTEIYLDKIIDEILADITVPFRLFRYVDDIVVFCESEDLSNTIYKSLRDGFNNRGLPINTEKSHNYGLIKELGQKDIDDLLHRNRFNYDLVEKSSSEIIFDNEKQKRLMKYLRNNSFDISLLGYIFSDYTFEEAKKYYYEEYGGIIMSSREGRGKYFREFYQYLFSDTDHILHAIMRNWFRSIPVDSINFSNFISTLYFSIQKQQIAEQDVRLIVMSYLNEEFDLYSLSDSDKATVTAIQLKYS